MASTVSEPEMATLTKLYRKWENLDMFTRFCAKQGAVNVYKLIVQCCQRLYRAFSREQHRERGVRLRVQRVFRISGLNTTCDAFRGSPLPCTNMCVLKGNVSLPWPQAREFCRSVGGELAILKTEWELKMLHNFLKGDEEDFDPHWIGARRIDGATHKVRTHYKWNDGSEIPKNFWVQRTHFLNGCVIFYYQGSHLYSLEDFYCTQSWPFVCELTHRS